MRLESKFTTKRRNCLRQLEGLPLLGSLGVAVLKILTPKFGDISCKIMPRQYEATKLYLHWRVKGADPSLDGVLSLFKIKAVLCFKAKLGKQWRVSKRQHEACCADSGE